MIYKHLHSNCSQESVSFAWETWYGMKGKDYEMHWFLLQKKRGGEAVKVLGGFRPKKRILPQKQDESAQEGKCGRNDSDDECGLTTWGV